MSLPVRLYPGFVSIQGGGDGASVNGIVPPTSDFIFGVIDQTWNGVGNDVTVGQSVMYNTKDVVATLVYSDLSYVVLPEDKIILIEDILP